mmetsp:Transcript_31292/g.101891  ORF Transcript_31292/g.101891 Transcript_31292/m.101891 type:complete len:283 (-) Transcript_31292:613-1461(-)
MRQVACRQGGRGSRVGGRAWLQFLRDLQQDRPECGGSVHVIVSCGTCSRAGQMRTTGTMRATHTRTHAQHTSRKPASTGDTGLAPAALRVKQRHRRSFAAPHKPVRTPHTPSMPRQTRRTLPHRRTRHTHCSEEALSADWRLDLGSRCAPCCRCAPNRATTAAPAAPRDPGSDSDCAHGFGPLCGRPPCRCRAAEACLPAQPRRRVRRREGPCPPPPPAGRTWRRTGSRLPSCCYNTRAASQTERTVRRWRPRQLLRACQDRPHRSCRRDEVLRSSRPLHGP